MAAEKLKTLVRREQIAQAALRLAARGGLKRLSVAAIARQVGFGPTAVYRHFKSKDEVLDAVLDLVGTRLQANVKSVHPKTGDPLEILHKLLTRHIALIRAYTVLALAGSDGILENRLLGRQPGQR